MGRMLKDRPARLVWTSQIGSVTGDRLYAVALVWVTLQLTGSPMAVAAVSIADTAPFLVTGVVSGWVADRWDGLRIARTVDVVRAAVVGGIPVLYVTGQLSVSALAAAAAILSGLEALFLPALQASLPRLVRPRELPAMVSMLDSTDRLGRVLGPGLIGMLAFIPEVHFFTIDAATFLVSAFCLTRVLPRAAPQPRNPGAEPFNSSSVLAGWRVTFADHDLRVALLLRGSANLAWPAFTVAAPFVIEHRFHDGLAAYGVLLAVFGLGNLPGTVLAARIPDHRLIVTCCAAWVASGLGFCAMAIAPNLWLFIGVGGCVGICTPLANVTVNRRIVSAIPHTLLARAYATQRLVVVAASVAGLPIIAALVNRAGASTAIGIAGAAIALTAGLATVAVFRRTTNPRESSKRGKTST